MSNLTIEVKLTASNELLAAIQSLTSAFLGTSPKSVTKTEGSTKLENSEKKVIPQKVQSNATQEEPETSGPETQTFTIEQLRAVVKEKSTGGKREQVKNILAEFGTTSVTNLAEEHYVAFMVKVKAL